MRGGTEFMRAEEKHRELLMEEVRRLMPDSLSEEELHAHFAALSPRYFQIHSAREILDEVAIALQSAPSLNIEIGGHTDSRGSEDYNQKLSQRRSQSVLDYLVSKDVDTARLSAVGYGMSQPMDSNDTDEGRERNRRVELKIVGAAAAAP